MKTMVRKVHYCEHCKKRYLQAPSCLKHEKSCTANPNRTCFMCERADLGYKDLGQVKLDLISMIKITIQDIEKLDVWDNDDAKRAICDDLMDLLEGCPACTLSFFRMLKWNEDPDYLLWARDAFDYKEAKKKFWKEVNNSREHKKQAIGRQ